MESGDWYSSQSDQSQDISEKEYIPKLETGFVISNFYIISGKTVNFAYLLNDKIIDVNKYENISSKNIPGKNIKDISQTFSCNVEGKEIIVFYISYSNSLSTDVILYQEDEHGKIFRLTDVSNKIWSGFSIISCTMINLPSKCLKKYDQQSIQWYTSHISTVNILNFEKFENTLLFHTKDDPQISESKSAEKISESKSVEDKLPESKSVESKSVEKISESKIPEILGKSSVTITDKISEIVSKVSSFSEKPTGRINPKTEVVRDRIVAGKSLWDLYKQDRKKFVEFLIDMDGPSFPKRICTELGQFFRVDEDGFVWCTCG